MLRSLAIAALALTASAQKVKVNLYDEAMCGGCEDFIVNDLTNLYNAEGVLDIVDINVIPFGNAVENPDGSITCQHGPDECESNLIQSCAIHHADTVEDWFPFIQCHAQAGGQPSSAKDCATKAGLDWETIDTCAKGDEGKQLEHAAAVATGNLHPAHTYTPWVTINDQHLDYTKFDQLLKTVCDAWLRTGHQMPHGCLNSYRRNVNAPVCHRRKPLTGLEFEANGIVCTLCETLVSEVDKLVESDKTKEEIASVLDSVCAKIPLVGDQCKAVVDDYLGDIIDLIVAQADPQTICKAISLC